MRKILLLTIMSTLVGCATHRPAPEPTGAYFPINEERLVPVYVNVGEADAVQKEK